MNKLIEVVARILLGLMFVVAGFGKIGAYAGTVAYMTSMGVPGTLLPLVIILEIGGGLMVIAGLKTKWAAAALALFSLVAAFIFHFNLSDQIQSIMFMKNLSITGGFMLLVIHGAGQLSLDAKISK